MLHEEHGEVVATWVERGYRDEHVVCFDRHLDLKPLSAEAARTCADSPGADLSALNRTLPMREAPGSFGLDDFWSVGPVSGRVGRLTWVIPGRARGPAGRRRLISAVSYIRASADVVDRTYFDQDRLRTELCGLTVDVCSLDDLLARPPADGFRIDVDLDWFAVPGHADEFDPRLLADELAARQWLDRLDSATYSVRSGFLDESQRRIADDLLAATRHSGQRRERSGTGATPALSLAMLRQGASLTPHAIRGIAESELHAFGAIGTALEGLLHLQCPGGTGTDLPHPDRAEHCWNLAAAAGVHSTWLAYGLGQHWYRRHDYGRARSWLDLARGELCDPLEGHAQVLAALCSARLGDLDDAADRAADLAAMFPLNERICSLAIQTAARAGRDADPDVARHLTIMTTWTNGGDSR
jgi:hypothetical protein